MLNDLAPERLFGVPRELDETEEYVCRKYKQVELADPIKQGTGAALVVRVAVMP